MLDVLYQGGNFAFAIILFVLNVFYYILFARVILTWFIKDPQNKIMIFLIFLTDPLMRPFRGISQRLMANSSIPLDLTPLITFAALMVLRTLITSLWRYIY